MLNDLNTSVEAGGNEEMNPGEDSGEAKFGASSYKDVRMYVCM